MAERTGSSLFQEAAGTLTRDVTCRLKIERKLSKERIPEPEPGVARTYVQGKSKVFRPQASTAMTNPDGKPTLMDPQMLSLG